MNKLSDTQRVILGAAAQRDDGNVLPLPDNLRGGAAAKVIGAMIAKGLIIESATDRMIKADAALNRIWRNDEDGRAIFLYITDAGLAAIGIEPEDVPLSEAASDTLTNAAPAPRARKPREGTKQAQLIAMLQTPEGTTIEEIVAATGWRSNTVRGAMSGALKKKLGLKITSEKIAPRGRVYSICD